MFNITVVFLLFGLEIAMEHSHIVTRKEAQRKQNLQPKFTNQTEVHTGKIADSEQLIEVVRQYFIYETQMIPEKEVRKQSN